MHFVGVSDMFISIHSADANNFEVIPALWGRICEVFEAIPEAADDGCYGVIYSDGEASRPDELVYIAGVRVDSRETTAPGMKNHSTSEGVFAVVEHRGPIMNLGETLRAFNTWLEGSDYERGDGAEIERYPPGWEPDAAEAVMETWIPVVEEGRGRPGAAYSLPVRKSR